MTARAGVSRLLALSFSALCIATTTHAAALHAQMVVGVVTDSATGLPIEQVTLTLEDSALQRIAETRTQANGRFLLDAQRAPRFRFAVRKVGAQPSFSAYYDVPPDVDTLFVDLVTPVSGVMIATVTVVASVGGVPNLNVLQLEKARQDNWQIVEPWRVAISRETSNSFTDLLRRQPLGGVRPPEMAGDCFSSRREMRRPRQNCLLFVVDGLLLDADAHINPMDVHFYAFIPAIKARLLYGPRAHYGAIFIATRRRGDDERRP